MHARAPHRRASPARAPESDGLRSKVRVPTTPGQPAQEERRRGNSTERAFDVTARTASSEDPGGRQVHGRREPRRTRGLPTRRATECDHQAPTHRREDRDRRADRRAHPTTNRRARSCPRRWSISTPERHARIDVVRQERDSARPGSTPSALAGDIRARRNSIAGCIAPNAMIHQERARSARRTRARRARSPPRRPGDSLRIRSCDRRRAQTPSAARPAQSPDPSPSSARASRSDRVPARSPPIPTTPSPKARRRFVPRKKAYLVDPQGPQASNRRVPATPTTIRPDGQHDRQALREVARRGSSSFRARCRGATARR